MLPQSDTTGLCANMKDLYETSDEYYMDFCMITFGSFQDSEPKNIIFQIKTADISLNACLVQNSHFATKMLQVLCGTLFIQSILRRNVSK